MAYYRTKAKPCLVWPIAGSLRASRGDASVGIRMVEPSCNHRLPLVELPADLDLVNTSLVRGLR